MQVVVVVTSPMVELKITLPVRPRLDCREQDSETISPKYTLGSRGDESERGQGSEPPIMGKRRSASPATDHDALQTFKKYGKGKKKSSREKSAVKKHREKDFEARHQHFTRSSARKRTNHSPSPCESKVDTRISPQQDRDSGRSLSPVQASDQDSQVAKRRSNHLKCFMEDNASISNYDFGDRIYQILEKMCQCNEESEAKEQNKSGYLFSSEQAALPLFSLIHQLVRWRNTSRSVAVVAMVLMDRIQQATQGITVTFANVAKVFTCCMLLAKKTIEDHPVWNADVLDFYVFETIDEVHELEKICLSILQWKTNVCEFDFRTYDQAILKPLTGGNQSEFRPYKKRKSITSTSNTQDY